MQIGEINCEIRGAGGVWLQYINTQRRNKVQIGSKQIVKLIVKSLGLFTIYFAIGIFLFTKWPASRHLGFPAVFFTFFTIYFTICELRQSEHRQINREI